jgi:predicted small lipoprotein YifL
MRKVVVVMVLAAGVIAGCGQKGPLYLPDKGGEVVTRPGGGQATQAPASNTDEQKKKDPQQNPR